MMIYKEVEQKAKEYDRNLFCTDKRFRNIVQVQHSDGSFFLFHHAFYFSYGEWYLVFTEHHKYHIYHKTDVEICMFNGPQVIPKAPKDF